MHLALKSRSIRIMDEQSPARRQSNSFAKSSFAALTVLAACFVLSALGRGLGESFTVFLLPISESFGWDRAQIISVYSLASLSSGLVSPLVGRIFDHFGPRIVYSLGLTVLGAAFLIAAYGQQLWQFQLSLGLCVGLGIASIGIVPNSILLGRWFGPGLPTAIAVIYSAAGAGVLLMLPISQLLIDHLGWRGAYQVFGGVVLLLLVPPLLLPRKRLSAGSPALGKAATADLLDDGWTLRRAIRHHAFWGLFSTFFFTAVGMFSVSVQIVAYLVDAGFSQLQAATAWGFSGVTLLFGMFSITWLEGLIGRRRAGVVQLCAVDRRTRDALVLKGLSQCMAIDRICGLVRQHDRLARTSYLGDCDEAVSWQAGWHHLRDDHGWRWIGLRAGLVQWRFDSRLHRKL